MAFLLATFFLCLGTIFGAYWFFVLRLEGQEKSSVAQRLKTWRADAKTVGIVLTPEKISHIPWVEALLKRMDVVARPRQLLVEAGLPWPVGRFLSFCFFGAALGFFLGWQILHLLSIALLIAAIGGALPYVYVRFKRSRRLLAIEEQFPEAMDLIARALRAGHAFTTGIGMVAEEIPPPVGAEFRRLYDEQNFGMSLPDAMRAMASRIPVLDARFFVTAVLTQRESGGNLSEVLDNLARVMRERFKVKRQIRVVSAHGRLSAWILVATPPVLAALMFMIAPQMMNTLVTDPMGVNLVITAAILQITGTYIIAKLVKIEY
jgi:tight adherence protein B